MIISEKILVFKNVLGYRKVKAIRIYVWIGLTIIFSFDKDFEKLNQMI